jgi:hypothetical protein
MVSVFTSSVVGRGFEPGSGQTKDYKFGIEVLYQSKNKQKKTKTKIFILVLLNKENYHA